MSSFRYYSVGFRDTHGFFEMAFFAHFFDRNRHYNVRFYQNLCSKKKEDLCSNKCLKIIQINGLLLRATTLCGSNTDEQTADILNKILISFSWNYG